MRIRMRFVCGKINELYSHRTLRGAKYDWKKITTTDMRASACVNVDDPLNPLCKSEKHRRAHHRALVKFSTSNWALVRKLSNQICRSFEHRNHSNRIIWMLRYQSEPMRHSRLYFQALQIGCITILTVVLHAYVLKPIFQLPVDNPIPYCEWCSWSCAQTVEKTAFVVRPVRRQHRPYDDISAVHYQHPVIGDRLFWNRTYNEYVKISLSMCVNDSRVWCMHLFSYEYV